MGRGFYGVLTLISLGNDRGREQDQPALLKNFSHSAHFLNVVDDEDASGGWNERTSTTTISGGAPGMISSERKDLERGWDIALSLQNSIARILPSLGSNKMTWYTKRVSGHKAWAPRNK